MVNLEEENEEEGEEDEVGKESMLKLFFMETHEDDKSSWTPKSLTPRKLLPYPLKVLQVLELWPMFPQCEHFLPIFFEPTQTLNLKHHNTKFMFVLSLRWRNWN